METNIVKECTGYIGVVKPEELEVEFQTIKFSTDDEGYNNFFLKIIDNLSIKDEKNTKICNAGYLPTPFSDFTMFMNEDQFNINSEYNMGFFGTPVYGNMVFLQIIKESENGDIIPIEENKKEVLNNAIKSFKKFEKDSGIYDSMKATDKEKFLEEFLKEKNSILQESTKDIKGANYEELEKAKQELKDMGITTEDNE